MPCGVVLDGWLGHYCMPGVVCRRVLLPRRCDDGYGRDDWRRVPRGLLLRVGDEVRKWRDEFADVHDCSSVVHRGLLLRSGIAVPQRRVKLSHMHDVADDVRDSRVLLRHGVELADADAVFCWLFLHQRRHELNAIVPQRGDKSADVYA